MPTSIPVVGGPPVPVYIAGIQGVNVDDTVGAIVTVDSEHHEIHEGDVVSVSYKTPDNANLADNGTISFLIATAAKEVHIVIRGSCGGDFEAEIYEGTAFTGGTLMARYNKRRSVAVPAGYSTVTRDVTVTVIGTLIFNFFFPGGSGGQTSGADAATRDEWIFRSNTSYLLRLTNRAGTAQPASMTIEWYEK